MIGARALLMNHFRVDGGRYRVGNIIRRKLKTYLHSAYYKLIHFLQNDPHDVTFDNLVVFSVLPK